MTPFDAPWETSLLKTPWGKGEIARNEQFLLFPHCFLSIWRAFCHFHKTWNYTLQTLSVWKSLKLDVWERVEHSITVPRQEFWTATRMLMKDCWILNYCISLPFQCKVVLFISLTHVHDFLTTLRSNPVENIVGKGENAGNQHFLLLPQCFLLFPEVHVNLLFSHIYFVVCIMLSSWSGLTFCPLVKSYHTKFTSEHRFQNCTFFIFFLFFEPIKNGNKNWFISLFKTVFNTIAVISQQQLNPIHWLDCGSQLCYLKAPFRKPFAIN